MRTWWALSCVGAIVVAALVGCPEKTPSPAPESTEPSPEAMTRSQGVKAIASWLTCHECLAGELAAVQRLGPAAVPVLRQILAEGASPASKERLKLQLEKSYQQLAAYAAGHRDTHMLVQKSGERTAIVGGPLTMTAAQYMQTYLRNLDALHRVRAAKALGAIGGVEARAALESADTVAMRSDERSAVENALAILAPVSR